MEEEKQHEHAARRPGGDRGPVVGTKLLRARTHEQRAATGSREYGDKGAGHGLLACEPARTNRAATGSREYGDKGAGHGDTPRSRYPDTCPHKRCERFPQPSESAGETAPSAYYGHGTRRTLMGGNARKTQSYTQACMLEPFVIRFGG